MTKTLTNKLIPKHRLYSPKMQEEPDLQQHGNAFNNIITDLVRLWMKINEDDKAIIFLFSLLGSYNHLVTYGKENISLGVITAIFFVSFSKETKRR